MNLKEFNTSKKTKVVKKALREHYEIDMNFDAMTLGQTKSMLGKVRGLLREARESKSMHASHKNPSYLKLVMMEQALSDHYQDIKHDTRIVVENEEVQKSQVILAAQDMIDSVQKMLEQVSKMKFEELPAVVNGIQNEFGVNESKQFNTSVGDVLTATLEALSTSRDGLTAALGTITGEAPEAPEAFGGAELGGAAPNMAELPAPEAEPEPEPEMEPELEPGAENLAAAGRGRR